MVEDLQRKHHRLNAVFCQISLCFDTVIDRSAENTPAHVRERNPTCVPVFHLEVQACGRVVRIILLQLNGGLRVNGRHTGGVLHPVQWNGPSHLQAQRQSQLDVMIDLARRSHAADRMSSFRASTATDQPDARDRQVSCEAGASIAGGVFLLTE